MCVKSTRNRLTFFLAAISHVRLPTAQVGTSEALHVCAWWGGGNGSNEITCIQTLPSPSREGAMRVPHHVAGNRIMLAMFTDSGELSLVLSFCSVSRIESQEIERDQIQGNKPWNRNESSAYLRGRDKCFVKPPDTSSQCFSDAASEGASCGCDLTAHGLVINLLSPDALLGKNLFAVQVDGLISGTHISILCFRFANYLRLPILTRFFLCKLHEDESCIAGLFIRCR